MREPSFPWPTTLSLPHVVERFLERCSAMIRNTDPVACERRLLASLPFWKYREHTWDPNALNGLGQGIFEWEYHDASGPTFLVVGTVDGAGMLRTINSCEER